MRPEPSNSHAMQPGGGDYHRAQVRDEPSGTAAALAEPWPLVGRELELARIIGAHADDACPGAVIHAAAGAGKSRLAREACTAAETMGELALWAQATASSATIPLGALASLVPDGVRSDDLLELMRRSTAALRERAGGREMFLAVDDAQLLDETSAGLVRRAVVGRRSATYRARAAQRRDDGAAGGGRAGRSGGAGDSGPID